MSVQTTLVPGSLVGVNQSPTGHGVDDWHGLLIGCGGGFFVAGGNCIDYLFDVRTEFRALPLIVEAMFFRLARTFFRLRGVCHVLPRPHPELKGA